MDKGLFNALTDAEMGQLGGMFARARRDCRKVMHVNWWNQAVTETYRQLVTDLQNDDPMFDEATRHAEMGHSS